MSKTETIRETATRLNEALDALEASVEPLFTATFSDQIGRLTDPIDQCKLEVSMAYAINTVFWIYFKTHGISPKDHQVFNELERVKKYFGKIKTAEGFIEKRTLVVNKPAVGRILKHALASNKDSEDVEDEATRFLNSAIKDQSTQNEDADGSNGGKRKGNEQVEDEGVSPSDPDSSKKIKKRKTHPSNKK